MMRMGDGSSGRADDPTVAAQLTPLGRGAIAVVAVRGPRAVEWVAGCFTPHSGRPFTSTPPGRFTLGLWQACGAQVSGAQVPGAQVPGANLSGLSATAREDLIVCRVAVDAVEVHCHGGQAAVARVLESLRASGCQIAGAGEESRVECLPGTLAEAGPWARAAWEALPQATTSRTAALLLDQACGPLDAAFARIQAAMGAACDPETEPGHRAAGAVDAADALAEVDRLLQRAVWGVHLLRPWRVVLVGPPNVGKSSLINAIVGFERAVVHAQAGTTRDVVTAQTSLAGWPVELSDTAGLRREADALEAAGIRRAVAEVSTADLLLCVRDITDPDGGQEQERMLQSAGARLGQGRSLVVWNKADLLAPDSDRSLPSSPGSAGYLVSARTGQGIDELLAAIERLLVPEEPPAGAAVPWTVEQRAWLEQARATLLAGLSSR